MIVDTEDQISLLKFKICELNDLCVKHHLEDFLSVGGVVYSHNVKIVIGILILECTLNWIF